MVHALAGRHPEAALLVLKDALHIVTGQPVSTTEVVDRVAMDAIEPLVRSSHPCRAIAVNQDRKNNDIRAIQSRSGIRCPLSVAKTLQSAIRANGGDTDPHGAVVINRHSGDSMA
jgi:hypothetical protein